MVGAEPRRGGGELPGVGGGDGGGGGRGRVARRLLLQHAPVRVPAAVMCLVYSTFYT